MLPKSMWKTTSVGFARPVLMLMTDILDGACVYKINKADGWPQKDLGKWFYENGGSALGWCRTKGAAKAKLEVAYRKALNPKVITERMDALELEALASGVTELQRDEFKLLKNIWKNHLKALAKRARKA